MAKFAFKKGLSANLPAAYDAGTIYITTDERAMYLDVDDSTRIRIGDFQEFATLAALQAVTNPSTTALYYVTELNCLAKYDGTKFVQINVDTGATSVEVVGSGNAVTAASYDPATRKLILTAGATYTTAEDVDKKITDKVGELKIGEETFSTVKEYLDKKTEGITSDASLTELTGRVTTAEEAIDALEAKVGTIPEGSNIAGMISDTKDKVDTLIGADANKSVRDIATEQLAAQLIPENAKESLDTLQEISVWIQSHPDDAAAMNKAISDLEKLVGTLPEGVTSTNVVSYIKEYTDAAVATLEADIHTHENKEVLDGITAAKVSAWDAAEQNAKNYTDTTLNEALQWGSF